MKMKDKNASVPEAIRKQIEERGMKQCAVAEKMGIAPQVLSDMLNGRRIIRPLDIENAAKALGCTPGDLFTA